LCSILKVLYYAKYKPSTAAPPADGGPRLIELPVLRRGDTLTVVASTVWKGQLTFGLVSFAVRLVRAARKERIPLRYVRETQAPSPEMEEEGPPAADHADSGAGVAPVRQAYLSPEDAGEAIPAGQLQRGYEVAPGEFAVIRQEELRRLRQPTSTDMQILRSVLMEEIDPVFLETSYYVHPGKGGERSYGLFYRALKDSGYAALAEVAMHGRQHVVVIRSGAKGLIAHTMYYVDEVRGAEEYAAERADVPAKELDLATRFVEAIAAPFQPDEFTDRYREQLESLIASKEPVVSRAATAGTPAASGNVVDIIEALRRSLEKVQAEKSGRRKPVERAAPARKSRKRSA
jgi:DNA end-binding protein Ku